jgi:hypothetical protein
LLVTGMDLLDIAVVLHDLSLVSEPTGEPGWRWQWKFQARRLADFIWVQFNCGVPKGFRASPVGY